MELTELRVAVQTGREKLERDRLIECQIVGPVYLAHASLSKQRHEAIAAGDDGTRGKADLRRRERRHIRCGHRREIFWTTQTHLRRQSLSGAAHATGAPVEVRKVVDTPIVGS